MTSGTSCEHTSSVRLSLSVSAHCAPIEPDELPQTLPDHFSVGLLLLLLGHTRASYLAFGLVFGSFIFQYSQSRACHSSTGSPGTTSPKQPDARPYRLFLLQSAAASPSSPDSLWHHTSASERLSFVTADLSPGQTRSSSSLARAAPSARSSAPGSSARARPSSASMSWELTISKGRPMVRPFALRLYLQTVC
jgi:hypothetical protein